MSIVFIGTSITLGVRPAGIGGDAVFPGQEFPALVAAQGALAVVNQGVAGNTTAQIAARFQSDVVALAPSAVVIEAGANDIHCYAIAASLLTPAQYKGYLAQMVAQAKAAGIRPTLLGPMFFRDGVYHQNVTPYLNAARDLAAEQNILMIDVFDRFAELTLTAWTPGFSDWGTPRSYMNDYVHPAPPGHAVIAALFQEKRYALWRAPLS